MIIAPYLFFYQFGSAKNRPELAVMIGLTFGRPFNVCLLDL
jgi:hypothetical protein